MSEVKKHPDGSENPHMQKARTMIGGAMRAAMDSGDPETAQALADRFEETAWVLRRWLRQSTGGVYPKIREKSS